MELYLITGFLGSGKTTLINQILNLENGKKTGLIVNEFGKEGVDGKLIKSGAGLEMKELNNGSVFCQCIKEDFIRALCDFQNYDLDIVFIEASGLSDHSNMLLILDSVKKTTGKEYSYKGSICVVDAVYFLEQIELLPVLERQISYSNVILINKIDLQTAEKISEIEEKIRSINKKAIVYKTSFCKFDPEVLDKVSKPLVEASESTNTVSTRPYSVVLKIKNDAKKDAVEDFIKSIMPSAYRIKGFLNIKGSNYIVNCVNDEFFMEETKDAEDLGIVVISKTGVNIISPITKNSKKFDIDVDIK